ncbi:MAG: hypothetical protein ABIP17_01420 [Ilumatobacteraceae bacterium]
MNKLPPSVRLKVPFLIAGFLSFLFSVFLYFVRNEEMAGIFVGLWVPSIHSLGTLILTPTEPTVGALAPLDTVSAR